MARLSFSAPLEPGPHPQRRPLGSKKELRLDGLTVYEFHSATSTASFGSKKPGRFLCSQGLVAFMYSIRETVAQETCISCHLLGAHKQGDRNELTTEPPSDPRWVGEGFGQPMPEHARSSLRAQVQPSALNPSFPALSREGNALPPSNNLRHFLFSWLASSFCLGLCSITYQLEILMTMT